MGSTQGPSVANIMWFAVVIMTQVIGASVLPRTAAFTNPLWTIVCLASYFVTLWTMAFLVKQGVQLSILIPLIAGMIPLVMIAVGIIFYHEAASLPKVMLLLVSCFAIGGASVMR